MRAPRPQVTPDALWALVLAAGAALLYLSLLTKGYVFEGLARAMPIELGRPREVFKGTYLLYGAFGYVFHNLLGFLGLHPPAFVSLQIMDALWGAGGLVVFFLTLRQLDLSPRSAAAWSAALGLSLAYWLWSTDAQNYIFSTVLLALNWLLLARFAAGKKVSPVLLGAAHALAIFGHLVNAVFAAPILWLIFRRGGPGWRRAVLQYAASAAACAAAVYAAVLALVIRPGSLPELRLWFIGSLADSKGRADWHGGLSPHSVWVWLKMTLNIFISRGPEPMLLLWGGRLLLLGLALQALRSLPKAQGAARNMAAASLVWVAAYGCVFTSWEPGTMVYRISDLIPLLTLLALGGQALAPAWRVGAPACLAALLAAGNLASEVRPRSLAANNPRLARMEFLKARTPEGSWVTVASGDAGNDELYLPFFAERRPLMLGRYDGRLGELTLRVDRLLAADTPVFTTSRCLNEETWAEILAPFLPEPVAKDEAGFALYRLRPRVEPGRGLGL